MRSVAFVLALLLATPTFAQDSTFATRIYNRILALQVPDGFTKYLDKELEDGSYVVAFEQSGQKAGSSKETVRVTVGEGVAAEIERDFEQGKIVYDRSSSARDIHFDIEDGQREFCLSYSYLDVGPIEIDGAQNAHMFVASCGSTTDHGLEPFSDTFMYFMVILIVWGQEDVYNVTWMESGAPMDTAPELDPSKWKPRAELLAKLRICPVVKGEAPPYPSCTG